MAHEAIQLCAKLINVGRVFGELFESLLTSLPESEYPNESSEAVLLEMFTGSAMPAIRRVGPRQCFEASRLISEIHLLVIGDIRLAAEIADRNTQYPTKNKRVPETPKKAQFPHRP